MTQQSYQKIDSNYNFDCQFRCGNNNPSVCKYQSLRLGHIVKTSHLFCNNSCPKNVYIDGQEDHDFLKKVFNRRYDNYFIEKVLNKHHKKTTIIVPKIWKNINTTYTSLLKKYSWFLDVGMTGSIVVDGIKNHKDIDVIIYINNIDRYVEWISNNELPSHIDNTKIDYYMYIDPYCQFFTSVWPNSKKIIMNEKFVNNIIVPKEYSIELNKGLDLINDK
jgi:hypothetical protein